MITIYTRPNCQACRLTRGPLDREGITYSVVNLDEHPDVAEQLREAGHQALPVVVTETHTWAGFQPDKIRQLTR
ncbi:NrdH-redoxin [Occultella glacieicola]|uniref:NrdH-redoxin n=1 Tax=Occultella glacieicola TaxID=2518684 RepID=A0ABY2DXJ2_9MICO|nr:glutaredoxin domain-containing protein [Occultella glacieicola]TDE88167.1 NrdH-redoxin [Occultella glacieicola]